ncbi:MAG: glycosyltransferase family 4 protein [Bacteroidota bacterium]
MLLVSNSAHNILHFRQSLWQALLQQDYEVIALAPADGKEHFLREAGIDFHPLPALKRLSSSPWEDFLLLRDLVREYRRLQPSVILHFTVKPNIYGSLAARWVKVPSIATITGLGTTWLNGPLLRRLTIRLYRASLPAAEVVVGQNAHDLEDLQKIGVRARRWQLIPGSGIDTTFFHPLPMPVYDNDERHFLFLGRMLIDKGVVELLHAWRQIHHLLPNAHLHLVGELDPAHPRCVPSDIWRQLVELPRVHFHAYQEQVRDFLSKSHVVILPSYREGIPRSILEAMAMGKPVISTDVPGCRELVISGHNGWRIPARSSAALAEAILQANRVRLLELEQLGERGRKLVVEGYRKTIIAEQYLDLIEELSPTKKIKVPGSNENTLSSL